MTKECRFGFESSRVGLICLSLAWILISLPCAIAQVNEDGSPNFMNVFARSGDTVLLPCDQDLPTPVPPLQVALYLLQWQRTDRTYPFYVVFDSTEPFVDDQYTGRVSIPHAETASLQITNVTFQDAGTYECQVLLLNGDYAGVGNGTFVNLVILRPPELTETPPPSVIFREGNTSSLQCLSNGIPTPVTKWYREGQQLRSTRSLTVQGDTITFREIRRDHGGTYLCRAENSEGEAQATTRVIIEGAPFIFVPPQDVTVLRSQDARFECEFAASPSNVSQRWYYEGAIVQDVEKFANRHSYLPLGGLSIRTTAVEDEGEYACSPSNGIGSPPTAVAYLTVHYPAFVISMPALIYAARSEPISIPCQSDSKPPVLRFIWRKNQREITVDQTERFSVDKDGTLTIDRAEYSDMGAYSCIPYNAVGTEGPSDAAVLRVIEKPSFMTVPSTNYFRTPNKSVTFKCIADGNPPVPVEWRKVEGVLPDNRHIITAEGLTLTNLTKDDTGVYECFVTNEVATVTASTHLFIRGTTPHMPYNISVLTSSKSAYVWWLPGYNGGMDQMFTVRYKPADSTEWNTYTDIPETVSSILIHDLRPSTPYQFSVTGHNKLGISGWSEPVTEETKDNSGLPSDPDSGRVPENTPTTPPRNLTLSVTMDGLLLSWLPPSEGAEHVSHYAVEYWIEGPWLVLEDRVPGEATEHLLTKLLVNTTYSFRMVAFTESSFSVPSGRVEGDTWGIPVYHPTSEPHTVMDITGILAGILAGIFCFLCVFLLACLIISCMQRRKRNKRMVFFSVVAHSDQSSDDCHRPAATSTPKGFLGKQFSSFQEKLTSKTKHPGYPQITVEPARPQNLRERLSKTSIGGRAGVYHVSSSEVLNATVSGRLDHPQTRHLSDGSDVNSSEAMEAEELNGIRLMEATEQLDYYSDDSYWDRDNVSQQRPHVKFQLASYRGRPAKPNRGQAPSLDRPPRPTEQQQQPERDWVSTSTLHTDREFTTRTFDPRPDVNRYDDPSSDCSFSYNGDGDGDPYDNEQSLPLRNVVFEDNSPGYDKVPFEMDGVFPAASVHYDEVPDELAYQAESLYASLRDDPPKRKFGVHEYALERSTLEKKHSGDRGVDPVPSDLPHEYLQLEKPTYKYSDMVVPKIVPTGEVRLSNDSGLNSDNSSQDTPQSVSETDAFEASLHSEDLTPSCQGPPVKSTPRPSNQSIPPVSISPLSISTNRESLSSVDPHDASIVGPLPDFGHGSDHHRKDTLSPQDSQQSVSSGYWSRNTSVEPGRGRDGGPLSSRNISRSTPDVGILPNSNLSIRGSGDDLTKYDPELEKELIDALRKYYESDGELSQPSNTARDFQEKERKEKRCEELKREFEQYRREQADSGAKSPRKTTAV